MLVVFAIGTIGGILTAYNMDDQHQKHQKEMQQLRDEIKEYKNKPLNVTCSWSVPIETLEHSKFPPLPTRKTK